MLEVILGLFRIFSFISTISRHQPWIDLIACCKLPRAWVWEVQLPVV